MPPWWLTERVDELRGPDFRRVLAGVRYRVRQVEDARALLTSPGLFPGAAAAAVGPGLHGRRAAFASFLPRLVDLERGLFVEERPWPWCWGDAVWISARWQDRPVLASLDIDSAGGDFVLGPAGGDPRAAHAAARLIAGEHHRRLFPTAVLSGRPPPRPRF